MSTLELYAALYAFSQQLEPDSGPHEDVFSALDAVFYALTKEERDELNQIGVPEG